MAEIIRGRDCVVLYYGDRQTVAIDPALEQGGWAGGQGVRWIDVVPDVRTVTYSNGLFGGFLVWGSDEVGDRHTAMTRNQVVYREATMFSGNCLILTSTYERYTLASRQGGGTLVPLVYSANDPLYFSLRGLWTCENELTLTGDPSAPAFYVGFVAQIPKPSNQHFLGIQTSL